MKSLTEFPLFKLQQGMKAKAELAAAGKTPEEITQSLGETFKMEGDKLGYFEAALEVASQNLEKLARIKVLNFAEGESTPPKAVKIGDNHYLPEFMMEARKPNMAGKADNMKKNNDKKGKGPKESPWGLTPEQIAAKKGGSAKAAKTPAN